MFINKQQVIKNLFFSRTHFLIFFVRVIKLNNVFFSEYAMYDIYIYN